MALFVIIIFMMTWSHLMIGTVVFGPTPVMVIATVAVDTFDYLNWFARMATGKFPWKLMKKNHEKFDKEIDSGSIWELHQFFNYSLWIFLITISLSLYFRSTDQQIWFVFFGS